MRWWIVVLAACGRLHFDPIATFGDGSAPSPDGGLLARQPVYIKASNTDSGDHFGYALALAADGNTLAVGAYNEASAAIDIGGNQADNSAPGTGAVYVFARIAGVWAQQAYIKPPGPAAGAQFGWSVALSSDGSVLAIGMPSASGTVGEAFVVRRAGSVWGYSDALGTIVQGSAYGYAVALSADGTTLAIGAPYDPAATTGVTIPSTDTSAPGRGAVAVLRYDGAMWQSQGYFKPSNAGVDFNFGWSIALSADGNTLAVGAINESGAATGINGNQLDQSAASAGAVYAFARAGSTWSQTAYVKSQLTAANDLFGNTVALSPDGSQLLATSINAANQDGVVYGCRFSGAGWQNGATLVAGNADAGDHFGRALAIGTSVVISTASGEDSAATGFDGNEADNSATGAGAAYAYDLAGAQLAYIKPPVIHAGDTFGWSAAITPDGTTLAIGSRDEASAAKGIGGDPTDNTAAGAGAVWVFQ